MFNDNDVTVQSPFPKNYCYCKIHWCVDKQYI